MNEPPRHRGVLFALFALLSIALVAGGFVFYRREARVIQAERYNELRAITSLKIGQIVSWRNERLGGARVAALRMTRNGQVAQWLAHPSDPSLKAGIQQDMDLLRGNYEYENILLLAPGGRVLLSLSPGVTAVEAQDQALSRQAIREGRPVLGDFFRCANTGQVVLDLAAPVFDPAHQPLAVLILHVDPEVQFYPLVQSWPLPSKTAETLLIRREGEQALFLNRLRHHAAPALTFTQPLSHQELPAARAIMGGTGEFLGQDYRGERVLAELQPVPGTPWFMVAKVDTWEILSETRFRGGVILGFAGVGVLAIGALLAFLFYLGQASLYRTQIALAKSETRFRSLHEGLRDAYVQVDMEGRILEHNALFQEMLGYPEEELRQLPYEDLTPAEWHDLEARIVREEILPLGYSRVYEKAYRRKDGTVFPVELRTVLLRGDSGEAVGMIAIVRDISERKAAEDQLKATQVDLQRLLAIGEQSRKALLSLVEDQQRSQEEVRRLNAELEQRVLSRTRDLTMANKELETFAYSVSHDLRAPLRHMDGFLSLLAHHLGERLDAQGAHYLGVAQSASVRMGQLVDALLAFSRLGRAELNQMPIDTNRLVALVREEFKEECANRVIRWNLGSLPTLQGDPTLVRLVFQNLMGNALKFTRGRPEAVIEIQPLECLEGERGFVVRDNGAGFDPAYGHKLFGVFQRLHREEEFEGTGIGLANVHRIVTRHGGRVWAEGSLGRGAAFFVTFPWSGRTS